MPNSNSNNRRQVIKKAAMSVLMHWNKVGLPMGVMIAAPFGDGVTLFRLAAQRESAIPGFSK